MKKIYYFLASALAVTAVSCSQSGTSDEDNDSVNTEEKQQYMEDINAGEEPVASEDRAVTDSAKEVKELVEAVVEKAAPAQEAQNTVATLDDRAAVAVLNNDKAFRPGTKVNRLTILDFNATWCGPCKAFAPAFEEVCEVYGNKADFFSVDVDNNPETASAFGVESIPSVVFILPNGTVKKYVGTGDLLPATKFETLVKSYLK